MGYLIPSAFHSCFIKYFYHKISTHAILWNGIQWKCFAHNKELSSQRTLLWVLQINVICLCQCHINTNLSSCYKVCQWKNNAMYLSLSKLCIEIDLCFNSHRSVCLCVPSEPWVQGIICNWRCHSLVEKIILQDDLQLFFLSWVVFNFYIFYNFFKSQIVLTILAPRQLL